MPAQKKISKATIRGMECLVERGKTFSEVASVFGVSKSSVQHLVSEEAKRKQREKKEEIKRKKLPKATRQKLERMYLDKCSVKQIAEETGLRQYQIYYYLDNFKITAKPKKPKPKKKTKAEIEQEKRTAEELEKQKQLDEKKLKNKRLDGACPILSCTQRAECRDINHPENCLVYQLYTDPKKKSLVRFHKLRKEGII